MTVEMFNLVRPTEQSNSSFFSYTVRILCSTILLLSIESHMLLLLLLFCRNVVLFYSSFEWIVISVVATNSKLLTEGKRGGCGFVSSYQLHEIIIPIILIMTYPCQQTLLSLFFSLCTFLFIKYTNTSHLRQSPSIFPSIYTRKF